MLKGHVFSKQLFENPIFALFINTFLNGENGVSNNYKNGMQVTYSGSTLTVDSGAVCIQGRFIEEDTSTQIATGTNNAYCKLVVEIDLDKQNTESQFNQASYKVITSVSGYPNLTQTNIIKNVSGIYQYELARFRTTASGIVDFQDMRTFLDFDSIFEEIRQEYEQILQELEDELASVVDGSDYLLKSAGGTVQGKIIANGGIEGNLTGNVTGNVSGSSGSCTGNSATATTASTCTGNSATATRLQTSRNIVLNGDVTGSASFNGSSNVTINTDLANIAVLTGTISLSVSSGRLSGSKSINYPSGYNKDNCVVIACGISGNQNGNTEYAYGNSGDNSSSYVTGGMPRMVKLRDEDINLQIYLEVDAAANTRNYKIVLMKI